MRSLPASREAGNLIKGKNSLPVLKIEFHLPPTPSRMFRHKSRAEINMKGLFMNGKTGTCNEILPHPGPSLHHPLHSFRKLKVKEMFAHGFRSSSGCVRTSNGDKNSWEDVTQSCHSPTCQNDTSSTSAGLFKVSPIPRCAERNSLEYTKTETWKKTQS